ncbi:TPA: hypothetical protein JI136_12365 [Acinetobacter baumannii]|nr:hypothetical protein [Acinetobacter baumannii]HAV5727219.1 hypothetical protein [Acinetobacter baumannii]HAV5730812.1 hypothetical protein [Acinetobacter baumannii]
MSVPEQIPYVGYVANGQTTEFPITFDLHDPEYLIVTVNKEIPVVGTYTVDMNALKVVFATAPTDGTQVELYRETELNRDTNYQKYDNSFRPEAVNYDFDKIWHVLQEQDMIDAELLARLKSEIEWRRTHDANFDELAKMRDAQIFSGLKGYIDTLYSASNPNIFDGVTAGIVFALDKKSVQTHLEIIYQMLNNNHSEVDGKVAVERERAMQKEAELLQAIVSEVARATGVEQEILVRLNALGGGVFGFMTYAAFDAAKATIPANSVVLIGEANNTGTGSWGQGDNIWNGTVLTKSPYDPYTLAIAQALIISKNEALKATANFLIGNSSNLIEFVDANLSKLAWLNEYGEFQAQDFITDFGSLNSFTKSLWNVDIPGATHVLIDKDFNILLKINTDGTVSNSVQVATYGIAEIRSGVASDLTANDLGMAYDKALTASDSALKMVATVSPFGADETRNQRMGSAIKVGPNKLYVAFSQFSTHSTDQVDGRLVGRFVDYDLVNQTYSVSDTRVIIGNKLGNVYRHPHFIQLRDRVLLIFNGAMDELFVYESFDKCETWQAKTTIDCTPPLPWATALDSAVLIEDGRYKGRIVLSLFRYSATDGLVGTVFSDDGGATWKRGQTLHGATLFPTYPSINETTVGLDAQNNLIFIIRNEEATAESRYLIFAKSTDGGETLQIFQQPVKTTALSCQTGIKQTAPTTFDGFPRMIVTCPTTEVNKGDRESFRLRVSYDNCKSWARTYKPFVDTLRVGYTSVIPLGSRYFAMVYEEGTLNSSQSLKILFFNLKEVM